MLRDANVNQHRHAAYIITIEVISKDGGGFERSGSLTVTMEVRNLIGMSKTPPPFYITSIVMTYVCLN